MYPDLQAKQEALEEVLNAWQADPARVKRLCGWDWIRKALKDLPPPIPKLYNHPGLVLYQSSMFGHYW